MPCATAGRQPKRSKRTAAVRDDAFDPSPAPMGRHNARGQEQPSASASIHLR